MKLPLSIENCVGEKIIFKSYAPSEEGDEVLLEAYCQPGSGPAMHTHRLQDEELTVVSGRMAYRTTGDETKYAEPGDTVLFKRGTPHIFWAEGNKELHCHGRIMPAHNAVFFISAIYTAQNKSGRARPDDFDAAYLLTRYPLEYDMPEIPQFIKKVIMPLMTGVGRILGKYKHFADAPPPIKLSRSNNK